jgi:hypothetical protein
MNKEKAETLLENYQALSELYRNTRKELERTRKALEIAVDALKVYANQENWDFKHFYSLKTYDIAKEALDQIKALEQKEG